eukprot:scaffold31483_cov70-Phaeocystis_antarctica.AAC.3
MAFRNATCRSAITSSAAWSSAARSLAARRLASCRSCAAASSLARSSSARCSSLARSSCSCCSLNADGAFFRSFFSCFATLFALAASFCLAFCLASSSAPVARLASSARCACSAAAALRAASALWLSARSAALAGAAFSRVSTSAASAVACSAASLAAVSEAMRRRCSSSAAAAAARRASSAASAGALSRSCCSCSAVAAAIRAASSSRRFAACVFFAASRFAAAALALALAWAAEAAALASASVVSRLVCCHSSSTVAVCFCCSAAMNAVLPSMICSEVSALASSSTCTTVGGDAVGLLQVDARAALQQHPHRRLLLHRGGRGRYQQRRAATLCAARIHAPTLVQPRSHRLRIALVNRGKHVVRQYLPHGRGREIAGYRRPGGRLSRLSLGVLPQQLSCRGLLELLGKQERRLAAGSLQRGVGLGVEQRLHDRGPAIASSEHQGGGIEGVLHVDARAALQQHPHNRLLPSICGRHQQRPAAVFGAARVHAAALIQPRSHSLCIALVRRGKQGRGQHGHL